SRSAQRVSWSNARPDRRAEARGVEARSALRRVAFAARAGSRSRRSNPQGQSGAPAPRKFRRPLAAALREGPESGAQGREIRPDRGARRLREARGVLWAVCREHERPRVAGPLSDVFREDLRILWLERPRRPGPEK